MDFYVKDTLRKWNLETLIDRFAEEEIDQQSFLLLDETTINALIPRIGQRVKFTNYYKQLRTPVAEYFPGVSYCQRHDSASVHHQTEKELALALVTQFPCLRDSEGSGYGVWYTPGRYRHPATGFLEERLRNIRKRLHSHSSASAQRSQTTNERRATVTDCITLLPDTEVSEADNSKMTEWLKKKYPRLLDTPGMIAQDFGILYPHAKDKLFELWGHASQRILSYCKTEKRALDLLPLQTNISSDTLGDVALKTLPAILPPLPYKIGSKMVRPSYQEAKEAFVDLQPVGTNIIQYLEEEEQRRQFPHVLQLGDKVNCSQAFKKKLVMHHVWILPFLFVSTVAFLSFHLCVSPSVTSVVDLMTTLPSV
ncbi:hypothetical protein G5714_007745 [Onychostoma macrolepis]|uniref:Uncharacterized protein n=1 Tax=Onychostoma macrolepis TaxID=369639 RepID=A0A7J6CUL5_9TELE|nr:hypothetical protein G5714_007745 [Onychostoma macrolepis]